MKSAKEKSNESTEALQLEFDLFPFSCPATIIDLVPIIIEKYRLDRSEPVRSVKFDTKILLFSKIG